MDAADKMNGRYMAEGNRVFRSPTRTETGFKMGYGICDVMEHLTDDAAQTIADALNMHMDAHPEKH